MPTTDTPDDPEKAALAFLHARFNMMLAELHGMLHSGSVRGFAFALVTHGETAAFNIAAVDGDKARLLHDALISAAGVLEVRHSVPMVEVEDDDAIDLEGAEAPSSAIN